MEQDNDVSRETKAFGRQDWNPENSVQGSLSNFKGVQLEIKNIEVDKPKAQVRSTNRRKG